MFTKTLLKKLKQDLTFELERSLPKGKNKKKNDWINEK